MPVVTDAKSCVLCLECEKKCSADAIDHQEKQTKAVSYRTRTLIGKEMCLLKVYMDQGKSGKKLIAEGIALVAVENGKITLKNLELEEIMLDVVEIVLIDTLNSVLLLKDRADQV